MGAVEDLETKLKIYMLITNRYKDLITEKENRSISEIRQKDSPYNDFIRQKKESLISDFKQYEYEKHFFTAVQRALSYVKTIRNCEFLLTFWMSFEEMEQLKVTDVMDKSILFAALLRAFGSEDVKVHVTRAKRVFVGFNWSGMFYLVDVKNSSMLSGPEADGMFLKDPLAYEFSDLHYDSFED